MNAKRVLTTLLWLFLLLSLGFQSGACNNVPVKAISGTFSVQNEVTDRRPEIPKIDILWVIDNSNSMCEEQINLTKNFEAFIKGFTETIQADFRIAVVTTHATGVDGGKFQVTQGQYETCSRQYTFDCTKDTAGDALCEAQFGPGWKCSYAGSIQKYSNGKVNSTCIRRCGDDQTCNAEFSDGQYFCLNKATFNTPTDFSSCNLVTDTTKCDGVDASLGFITNNTPDIKKAFECIATVGTTSDSDAQLEMGLLAAKLALDKNGKNGTQATNFLRDDAFLAIIMVSDEDDCSIKEGEKFTEDELRHCGFVNEKLEQVGEFVKFFKRLKKDPGKVIVATIAGEAKIDGTNPSDPGFNLDPRVIQERDAYLTTKQMPNEEGAYICVSDNGRADFGRRYRELVDKFGSNGVFANICDNDFGPALQLIAKKIIDIFAGSCLSRP
ncbi:MAG: VWA domain-containing protein, partial [Myxococcales bacterium]|nr:VWA domain-containing protein [Myxococcales bacterium]